MRRSVFSHVAISLALLCCLGLLTACEEERPISYRNESSKAIQLFIDDRYVDVIAPGDRITRSSRAGSHHIKAVTEDGSVLLADSFTWDELRGLNFTVVIQDD